MACKHKFFEVRKINQYPGGRITQEGIRLACAFCGEVRDLWETGQIEVRIPAHESTGH